MAAEEDGITDSIDMSMSKPCEESEDREAWGASSPPRVSKSQTRLKD